MLTIIMIGHEVPFNACKVVNCYSIYSQAAISQTHSGERVFIAADAIINESMFIRERIERNFGDYFPIF